jgi:hypothetical protein
LSLISVPVARIFNSKISDFLKKWTIVIVPSKCELITLDCIFRFWFWHILTCLDLSAFWLCEWQPRSWTGHSKIHDAPAPCCAVVALDDVKWVKCHRRFRGSESIGKKHHCDAQLFWKCCPSLRDHPGPWAFHGLPRRQSFLLCMLALLAMCHTLRTSCIILHHFLMFDEKPFVQFVVGLVVLWPPEIIVKPSLQKALKVRNMF